MDEFVKPLLSLQVDPPAKGAKRLKIDGPSPSCPEYIGQLIHDKKVISALPQYGFSTYHVIRLLNHEIESAAKTLPQDPTILGDLVTCELYLPDPDLNEAEEELTEKIFAPKLVESRKDINMVGRLLGPQGVILQALEANTGTKVTIRGKQSLRKGQKPRPGDDEELHVVINCQDTPTRAKLKMDAAKRDLQNLWNIPEIGEVDVVKTRQLRLARMMDGNYDGEEEMEESIVTEVVKPIDYEKELSLPPIKGEEKVTLTAKVPIPVDEKPDFNWVGRIIGPGGVTLKSLESKSGCKVSLRGKGSVRESEVASGVWKPSMDSLKEPLHILITAQDESHRAAIRLQKCIDETKKILVLPENPEDDEVKKEQQKFIEEKKNKRNNSANHQSRGGFGNHVGNLAGHGGLGGFGGHGMGGGAGGMGGGGMGGLGMGGGGMGAVGMGGASGGGMALGGGVKNLMNSMSAPAPLMSGGGSGYGRMSSPMSGGGRGFGAGASGGYAGGPEEGMYCGENMYGGDGAGGQFTDTFYDAYSWDTGDNYGSGRGGGKMQSAARGRGGPRGGFGQGASAGMGQGFGMGGGMGSSSDGMRLRVQPYPLIGGTGGNRGSGARGAGAGRQSSYLGGGGY